MHKDCWRTSGGRYRGSVLLWAGFLIVASGDHRALGDDWPQWRGLNRNGMSRETGLLRGWSGDNKPVLVWHASGLGEGYAGVVVSRGMAFTVGKKGRDIFVFAWDADTGKQRWNRRIGMTGRIPSSTPTVDRDRVFALDPDGNLVCLKTSNGDVVWKKSFLKDFGGRMMSGRGYGESPLIDGNKLICTPGGAGALMVALDKRTGKLLWKTKAPELGTAGRDGAAFSSVVVSEAAGVRQYVQFVGRGLVGVDAKNGRFLWGYNGLANRTANIPTPVVRGNLVFAANGYNAGSVLLKLQPDGKGRVKAVEVYRLRANRFQNHHGGFVLIGGHIYGGHGSNNGLPTCLDLKTGRVVWKRRGPGVGSAAVISADGHLYFRYQNGVMALIEATPKGYRLKGTFRIPGAGGDSWAHPAIADGRLFLREKNHLWVYGIRGSAATKIAKTPLPKISSAAVKFLRQMGVSTQRIKLSSENHPSTKLPKLYRYAVARRIGKPGQALLVVLKNKHVGQKGTLSPQLLGQLKKVRGPLILDLAGTRVSDAGLAQLSRNPKLVALNLELCRHVNDAGLRNLQTAGNLRVLILTGTRITNAGLKHLVTLKSLVALDLEVCDGVTDAGCVTLGSMPQLQALNLKKTGFEPFRVSDTGLRSLRNLRELRVLNLYGNKITDNGLAHLAGKKQLRELDLSLLAITDRGLVHLKSLENLHSLQLLFSEGFAGPKVTDAGLGNLKLLTKLRSLNLIGAKISDGGLQRLKPLTRLTLLKVANTPVTAKGVQRLKAVLPKCVVVR